MIKQVSLAVEYVDMSPTSRKLYLQRLCELYAYVESLDLDTLPASACLNADSRHGSNTRTTKAVAL